MELVLSIAFVALLAIVVYVHKETVDIKKKYELRNTGPFKSHEEAVTEAISPRPRQLDRCVTQIGRRF
jgi:hypothetical protein